jgi:hypothetical protein
VSEADVAVFQGRGGEAEAAPARAVLNYRIDALCEWEEGIDKGIGYEVGNVGLLTYDNGEIVGRASGYDECIRESLRTSTRVR